MARALVYVGIGLTALAALMLEILLTRITSVVVWYHLAFFIVSLAMLGMTAGAVWVFLDPARFAPGSAALRLHQTTLAFAWSIAPAMIAALAIPLGPAGGAAAFLALVGYGACLAVPFLFAGAALTIALTRAGLPPGLAYGVDLCGAAAGCWLVIPLLDRLDAPSAALACAAVGALGALAFARAGGRSAFHAGGLAVLLGGAAVVNATLEPPLLRPRWVKGEREDPAAFERVVWNTYSRVTVGRASVGPPSLWSVGRTIPAELLRRPTAEKYVVIDGAARTVLLERADRPERHPALDWDVTSFAHRLGRAGPVAVIGVGGGRDAVAALRASHRPVVGIELNDAILDLHRDREGFSRLGAAAGVELVADEARSYLARDERRYAVIVMSLIDTWAATGAGAFSLSENGLYTVEAWSTLLDRLQPDGILSATRWFKPSSPGETARMLALAYEVLWRRGIDEPARHVVVVHAEPMATLLLSPAPFSAADLRRIDAESARLGIDLVLGPQRAPTLAPLAGIVAQRDSRALAAFLARERLDLRPPTDDRPFFFSMLRPADWLADRDDVAELDFVFLGNLRATQTLLDAIAASALLTLVVVIAPLVAARRRLRGQPAAHVLAAGAYFALIGAGFMLVEIGFLSRIGVFLGHPVLALAVVLGGMVLFTGLGSLASSWVSLERRAAAVLFPLVPAALVAAAAGAAPRLLALHADAGVGLRFAVAAALLAPPALGLGLCFPLGLRLATSGGAAPLAPWLWGLNGAFGVLASGLALAISMIWGVSATLAAGALCYAVLPALTVRLAQPRGAHHS